MELLEFFEDLAVLNLGEASCQETERAILSLMISKKVIESANGLTVADLTRELKLPRSSIQRAGYRLESAGIIDRRTKGEGYYLSYGLLKRLERIGTAWRKQLRELEKEGA